VTHQATVFILARSFRAIVVTALLNQDVPLEDMQYLAGMVGEVLR
jgi:hypothetical protein